MKKAGRVTVGVGAGLSLAAAGLLAARLRRERRMRRVWRSLELPFAEERFSPEMVDGLPAPARRYLLHSIQTRTRLARSVRLRITGSMKLARGARPMPMASEQIIAPPIGYIWRASVGKGPLRFSGFDLCSEGSAEMRWWTVGVVPIVRAQGPELARSAAGRLLGETIFVPSTLLLSDGVRWEPLDDASVRVRLSAHGEEVAMTLEVDDRGRLVRASFPRWNVDPKIGPVGYLPFVSEGFGEERTFSGYTIPTRFQSGWRLGSPDELRFFFGKIEVAEYTP
jgi:hypothetical protein